MFFKPSIEKATERLFEEQLYSQVATELFEGKEDHGIWAKAIADAEGNSEKAKGLYIKHRVQSIKDEILVKEQYERQKHKYHY